MLIGQAGPTASEADKSRAVVRLSAQYFLRTLDVAKAAHGGDPLRAIIFTAIWSANVGHIRPNAGFDSMAHLPPDDLRRPVTIAGISQSLGMPAETVRRYIARLIDEGLCVRHGRKGVIVPSEVFARPDMIGCVAQQHAFTAQYHRALSNLLD